MRILLSSAEQSANLSANVVKLGMFNTENEKALLRGNKSFNFERVEL